MLFNLKFLLKYSLGYILLLLFVIILEAEVLDKFLFKTFINIVVSFTALILLLLKPIQVLISSVAVI